MIRLIVWLLLFVDVWVSTWMGRRGLDGAACDGTYPTYLSIYLSFYLSIYLSLSLSFSLSLSLSMYTYIYIYIYICIYVCAHIHALNTSFARARPRRLLGPVDDVLRRSRYIMLLHVYYSHVAIYVCHVLHVYYITTLSLHNGITCMLHYNATII